MNGVITRPQIEVAKIGDFLKMTAATGSRRGCRQLYTFTDNVPQLLSFYRNNAEGADEALSKLYFTENKPYYVTKNSFFANYRRNDSLFSLDNIVIDCDVHDGSLRGRELDHELDRLTYSLENDYSERMPSFNLCRSGRGAHLWVGLESFTAKLQYLHNIAALSFADTVARCIHENGLNLEVDTAATTNAAGLIRLPYTFNQHTGTQAIFETRTSRRYTVDELQAFTAINIDEGRLVEKSLERRCKGTDEDRLAYIPLHKKRLRFLDVLIQEGVTEGRRDLVLFQYVNSSFWLTNSADGAREAAQNVNRRFAVPLPQKKVDEIVRYILEKGGLTFKKMTFLAFLNATPNERLLYISNLPNQREADRAQAREAKTDRDRRIMELKARGYTQTEVAAALAVSLRTVKRRWN